MTQRQTSSVLRLLAGLSLAMIAAASPAAAQGGAAHLVHDFFPGELQGGRPSPQLTQAGNALFFVAADLATGRSVWRTDGTAAGTGRVEVPADSGSLSSPRMLGALGDRAIWTATARIDANSSTTVLLGAGSRDGAAVLYSSVGTNPKIVGQRLFFVACPDGECAVWSTDGTAAGTAPVPALASRPVTARIFEALADRWLVFRSGSTLLAYDVVRAATFKILTSPAFTGVYPTGETLFVLTAGPEPGVWASRLGEPAATQVFFGSNLIVAGWRDGKLYFATKEGRLWSTDGRPEGTLPYSGLRIDAFSLRADQLGGVGSRTLIPMPGYYGGGLLSADAGTHEVRGILRACSGKYPCLGNRMSAVTAAGGKAFEVINSRLAQSDGTPEGTGYGTGLRTPDASSFGVVDDRLVLGASRQGVQQLWSTDGTAAGTKSLTDGTRDRPFRVEGPPISYNGALFVAADRPPVGQQLWRVEGGRTTPLTDLHHLPSGINPTQAFAAGDRVLLQGGDYTPWLGVAADGAVETLSDFSDVCRQFFFDPCTSPVTPLGRRIAFEERFSGGLWTTDGTAAGTSQIQSPDANDPLAFALGRLGDRVLVLGSSAILWSSDGDPAVPGTPIARLPFNPAHPERFALVSPIVSFGSSAVLFRRAPGPTGPKTSVLEVWRTDGTAAGTLLLASTPFPPDYSTALSPAVVGGRLFFRFGGTLWASDGSPSGTRPLPQQLPGGTFALAAGASTLYAAAGYQDDDTNHETLWAIDPATLAASPLGTFGQLDSGAVGAILGTLVGDTLFFGVTDPQDPLAIETVWRTEGTQGSTRKLPAPLSSLTSASFHTAGERRYFTFCDAAHGCELWSTDRLGEGTRLAADVWPGLRDSDPEILAADGKSLLFAATGPETGRELWRLDP
jgi:ELWxxDGT repeat protein